MEKDSQPNETQEGRGEEKDQINLKVFKNYNKTMIVILIQNWCAKAKILQTLEFFKPNPPNS